MSFRIIKADEAKAKEISHIFNDVLSSLAYYNDIAKESEIEKYTEDALCRKINDDPYSVLIAEEANKVIGFCFNRLDDMTIWLEWFGVIPSARGNKIAEKMLLYLVDNAVKRGVHKIWCDCRTSNLKSIKLLSSLDFVPLCTIKNHWYKQDFILWQKEIN